jgi:hypothetical protein
LLSAFFLGCLFATALLDERLANRASAQVVPPVPMQRPFQAPGASF